MQRTALIDAARELVLAGGVAALTFPALAEKTGLARSSVYEYFGSRAEVIEALIVHDFPAAFAEIRSAIVTEVGAERQLAAYVRRQLEYAAEPRHRILLALSGTELDGAARERVRSAHAQLVEPVVAALRRLGHPDPRLAAQLLQGMIDAASRRIAAGARPAEVIDAAVTMALRGCVRAR